MKKSFTAAIVCTTLALLSISCNKEVLEPTTNFQSYQKADAQSPEIIVLDGHLCFKNETIVLRLLNSFSATDSTQSNIEKMIAFEKQYSAFKSMRKAYNELVEYGIGNALTDGTIDKFKGIYRVTVEPDGQKSYDRAIFYQGLSTLLNAEGVFQIGDSLFRISEERTIALSQQYKAEINDELPAHGVIKTVVHRYAASSNPNARPAGNHDEYTVEYQPDGLTLRRFRAIGVSTNYGFTSNPYWEAGYKVWHQRNNWWGWGTENADRINIYCNVQVNGQLRVQNGIYSIVSGSADNVSEQERKWTESWSATSVGLVRVAYTWTGTGNGANGGVKPVIYREGVWEENI